MAVVSFSVVSGETVSPPRRLDVSSGEVYSISAVVLALVCSPSPLWEISTPPTTAPAITAVAAIAATILAIRAEAPTFAAVTPAAEAEAMAVAVAEDSDNAAATGIFSELCAKNQ